MALATQLCPPLDGEGWLLANQDEFEFSPVCVCVTISVGRQNSEIQRFSCESLVLVALSCKGTRPWNIPMVPEQSMEFDNSTGGYQPKQTVETDIPWIVQSVTS